MLASTKTLVILLVGQSGNVLSGHYDDFIKAWRPVDCVPMYWSKDRLQGGGGVSTLRLVPEATP